MHLLPIVFLIFTSIADIRTRKIRNWTTYPMVLLGLLLVWHQSGTEGLLHGLGGMLVAGFLVAFLPGFKTGGGDIKLAAACGVWLGTNGNRAVFLFVFLSMLLLWLGLVSRLAASKGLCWLWRRILLEFRIIVTGILAGSLVSAKIAIADLYTEEAPEQSSPGLPAAPAMLLGYCATLYVPFFNV